MDEITLLFPRFSGFSNGGFEEATDGLRQPNNSGVKRRNCPMATDQRIHGNGQEAWRPLQTSVVAASWRLVSPYGMKLLALYSRKPMSYRKSEKIQIWGLGGLGEHFYCKFREKSCTRAPQNDSASFWANSFWVSLWETQKSHMFHDCRTFLTCPWLQTHCLLSIHTPKWSKHTRKAPAPFWKNMMFGNLRIWNVQNWEDRGQDVCRRIPPIRLIPFWKPWIWD